METGSPEYFDTYFNLSGKPSRISEVFDQLTCSSKAVVVEFFITKILDDFCLNRGAEVHKKFTRGLKKILLTHKLLSAKKVADIPIECHIRHHFSEADKKTKTTGLLHFPNAIIVALNYLIFVLLKVPSQGEERIGLTNAAKSSQVLPGLVYQFEHLFDWRQSILLAIPAAWKKQVKLRHLDGRPCKDIKFVETQPGDQEFSEELFTITPEKMSFKLKGDQNAFLAFFTSKNRIEEESLIRLHFRKEITREDGQAMVQPLLDLGMEKYKRVDRIQEAARGIDKRYFFVLDSKTRQKVADILCWVNMQDLAEMITESPDFHTHDTYEAAESVLLEDRNKHTKCVLDTLLAVRKTFRRNTKDNKAVVECIDGCIKIISGTMEWESSIYDWMTTSMIHQQSTMITIQETLASLKASCETNVDSRQPRQQAILQMLKVVEGNFDEVTKTVNNMKNEMDG